MKRITRITESDLTRIVRRVISEQSCSADDQKPSSNRPFCSQTKVNSGNIISVGKDMFLQYKDESNCPKLCKVEQETKVTLS